MRRKGLGRQWPRERGSRGRSGSLRGRRCGAGAGTWAGNGLVSEDHAEPRKSLRGIVMKPILVNARGAGAAAVRSPLRCCGLPTPLMGSEISEAPWQTPRHWQSHCTGASHSAPGFGWDSWAVGGATAKSRAILESMDVTRSCGSAWRVALIDACVAGMWRRNGPCSPCRPPARCRRVGGWDNQGLSDQYGAH